MKFSVTLLLTLALLAFSCSREGWSQERFVEQATVLVTGDPICVGRNPWLRQPDGRTPMALNKGWKDLKMAPVVPLQSGAKVEFYVTIYSDHRGRVTGKPGIKVAGKRITINITERYTGGPKTPVFEPSLWFERVTAESLAKGVYEVFLHGTMAGKVSIP